MTSDNYQKILDYLGEESLTFVLLDSLNQKKLVKLCNSCGIEYPGMRTKSVPAENLAMDLAEEFYLNAESRKIMN
jgi:hypothetical protein